MIAEPNTEAPPATVDVRQLNTVRWGPIRQMFPAFVENIELGRYVEHLVETQHCRTVQLRPHYDTSGSVSTHVFDVVCVHDAAQSM